VSERKEVREFLYHLQFVKRYSAHTIKAYSTDLSQFHFFFKSDLLTATLKDVRKFLKRLIESQYSLRTVNRKLEVLKSFYRYHFRQGNIPESPCLRIPQLRFIRPKGRFIPAVCVKQVLDDIVPGNCRTKLRDKLILEILYFTGCRASEIINLKTNQINYFKRQIKIVGKGNFERIVLVNAQIINLIKSYRRKSKCCKDSGNLFTTDKGKKIYPMFLWRLVRRYFKPKKLGINTSAHILRHSIATHLYHNRAPLHSIKRFLGHRSLKTTVLYLHFGPEHLKKVYQDAHPKERRAAFKLAISTSKDERN
jgi:integrase/recombinase XerC